MIRALPVIVLSIIVLMLLAFVMGIGGCTSTKEVSRNTVSVDSSSLNEKSDSIKLLKIELDRLTAEIRELQYSSVQFDTVYLPGDTIRNTVIIKADGTIEAKGKITSAYVSKNLLIKIVNEKQRVIDSLSLVKNKVQIQYKTIIKTVEKKTKRTFLNQWWLFPAGFLSCMFLIYRKKVVNLFT